jgi:hypothetical protein
MNRRSTAICIPGGYRSGSTALCQALVEANVFAGDYIITQWENADIWAHCSVELHKAHADKRLIEGTIPHHYQPSPQFVARLQEIKTKLDNCGHEFYFIKDPQIARLMQAFVAVWPDAKYICCDREAYQATLSQRKREKIGPIKVDHLRRRYAYTMNMWHFIMYHQLDCHILSHSAMSDPVAAEMEERALGQFLGFGVPLRDNWKHHVNARALEDLTFSPLSSSGQPISCASQKPSVSEDASDTAEHTSQGEQEAQSPVCP